VVGKVVGTAIVVIAVMIQSAGDTVTNGRMIVGTGLIGANVDIGLDHPPRLSDLTVDTEANETANMTVIAEMIDAEAIILVPVETTATVTAMVNVIAMNTRRGGILTPANLESETRVPNVIVIRATTARDPYNVHLLGGALLPRSTPNAVTTAATVTDKIVINEMLTVVITPAETTIIATTHTTEAVAHLLPVPRLTSRTPSNKRKSASASSPKCSQMLASWKQTDANEFLRSMQKNIRRRSLMISNALTVVNSCPRYISVCRKTAWMSASGAVVVDCPRWRRIKGS
jgi:hypothetical protein